MSKELLPVLCIGALDPSGNSGLNADARACAAFGAHALTVATAVLAQNTRGVTLIEPIAPEIVLAQLEALLADIEPAAIKIGMVPGVGAAEIIARCIRPLKDRVPIVIDPVFSSCNGIPFCDDVTIEYFAGQLLPLATIVTPNIVEADRLCGVLATDLDSMAQACLALYERVRSQFVLITGGHLPADEAHPTPLAIDLLFNGQRFLELRAIKETTFGVCGTGSLFAAALAAGLADGKPEVEAARGAKMWLTQQIRAAQILGQGDRVVAAS